MTEIEIGPLFASRARLWFEIMLSTALRPSDALKVRWDDYDAETGLIQVVQGKDRTGAKLHVPVTPALAELLGETPRYGFTIIADARTTNPVSYRAMNGAFTAVRRAAALPIGDRGCVGHGLRVPLVKMLPEGEPATRKSRRSRCTALRAWRRTTGARLGKNYLRCRLWSG